MSRLANQIRGEISSVTQLLTQKSLSIDSRLAQIKVSGKMYEVGWSKEGVNIAFALKDISYAECYQYLYDNQQYNFILPDGALIQLLYRFNNEKLYEQRVCYFPSPNPDFNNQNPLIRIDYNPIKSKSISHSSTHLHLGYTKDCRIPTSAPIAPNTFILFILRSFYSNRLDTKLEKILQKSGCFVESILKEEKEAVHFKIPSQ